MKCQILKAFHYSDDGITAVKLAAGTVAEIRPELAAGLIKEGWAAAIDDHGNDPRGEAPAAHIDEADAQAEVDTEASENRATNAVGDMNAGSRGTAGGGNRGARKGR